MQTQALSDFNQDEPNTWRIVNDGIMGGLSEGKLTYSEDGVCTFDGDVSLDNNGGFTSMRLPLPKQECTAYSSFLLRIKGDGKKYQFRCKSDRRQPQSYLSYFEADTNWQEIVIPFDSMYPSFRGRKSRMPNFQGKQLNEVGILIGNKKAESFSLTIDWIKVR